MAETLAQLQTRLEELNAAIDSGALSIRQGNDSTLFRSMDEMIKARDQLEARINLLDTPSATRVRAVRFTPRSGF